MASQSKISVRNRCSENSDRNIGNNLHKIKDLGISIESHLQLSILNSNPSS